MPNLRHLLEELERLEVDPDEIRLSPRIFHHLIGEGEDIAGDDVEEDD